MNRDDAINVILTTIKKIKNTDIKEKDYNSPITGIRLNFSSIELTYLFLEIRKLCKINFLAEDVEDYAFNTINLIADTIVKKTTQ